MSGAEPVLLDVTRGGVVESQHRGIVVLVDPAGEVTTAGGDVTRPVFARSTFKPMQAAAMVADGFTGPTTSIALSAASHDGEDVHLGGARAILGAAGLDEHALQCPPDLPSGRAAMLAWVRAGKSESRLAHNCSGKHSAMVATCVVNGWDVDGYLDPGHPLQAAIGHRLEALCGAAITTTSVDGCGAPAHAVPLVALARGFAAIASAPAGSPEGIVADAMRTHPELVGGTGRAVTELMAEVDGLVAKDGAEGVWAAALPDGRAFAAKVADGSARALPGVLAAALAHWGFDGAAVRRHAAVPMLGGGVPVGAITWSPELRGLFGL